jgi:hypothetical protein
VLFAGKEPMLVFPDIEHSPFKMLPARLLTAMAVTFFILERDNESLSLRVSRLLHVANV